MLALLGERGARKTTIIRCVAGLVVLDGGEIRLDGADLRTLDRRECSRIAVVFQPFNLVGRLTALENVLAGRLAHVSAWRALLRRFSRADRLHALECLDRVGLLHHVLQRADTLSGGQQQRVAIARALAQRPEVIVADEPVASLDPRSGAAVPELLGDIARVDRVAVLCSMHQVELARRHADRIVGLVAGRLVADVPAGAFDQGVSQRIYGAARPEP